MTLLLVELTRRLMMKLLLIHLKKINTDDILLLLDINSVAGGEYSYVFTADYKTDHNKLFYTDTNYGLTSVPKYTRPSTPPPSYAKDFDLPYYHEGYSGASAKFYNDGVCIANNISFNWKETSSATPKEYKGQSNLKNTSQDTLASLVVRLGGGSKGEAEINKRIDNVVKLNYDALTNDNFVKVMQDSKAMRPDYSYWTSPLAYNLKLWLTVGISLLLIIAAAVIFSVWKKKVFSNLPPVDNDFDGKEPIEINPFEEFNGSNSTNRTEEKREDNSDKKPDNNDNSGNIFEGFDF